mgnify:CR=1 FL=1
MEYVGQKMICDMRHADGNVLFDKEYIEFSPRNYNEKKYELRIFYRDITAVKGYKGIKSTVVIEANGKSYEFYMYKMNTFIDFVEQGRKNWNVVDIPTENNEEKKQEPLTDAQLEKLSKLSQLHKDGVLNDEEFEKEKNLILNR